MTGVRMKRAIAVALLTAGLAGCAGMSSKIARLEVGTPRNEVVDRLGARREGPEAPVAAGGAG